MVSIVVIVFIVLITLSISILAFKRRLRASRIARPRRIARRQVPPSQGIVELVQLSDDKAVSPIELKREIKDKMQRISEKVRSNVDARNANDRKGGATDKQIQDAHKLQIQRINSDPIFKASSTKAREQNAPRPIISMVKRQPQDLYQSEGKMSRNWDSDLQDSVMGEPSVNELGAYDIEELPSYNDVSY